MEKTALAEAEVEYHDYTSDTVWVKFPVKSRVLAAEATSDSSESRRSSSWRYVVIWTTTPWTIPGNRAISYSSKIAYGLYRGDGVRPMATGQKTGDILILADKLADAVMKAAKVEAFELQACDVTADDFA